MQSIRRWLGATLLLAVLVGLHSGLWPQSSKATTSDHRYSVERGAWSGKTVSLFNTWGGWDSNPGRQVSFASPDGSKLIEVKNDNVTLVVGNRRYATGFGALTNAELGWAPDSRHFFVTWTDGGETGTWYTEVYVVTDSGLHDIRGVSDRARRDFARIVRHMPIPKDLATPEGRMYWSGISYCPLNVVGSQWLNGSSELLLSVLVPNVGRCRQMSEFNVYRVAVPSGKILERYTAQQAHQKFGDDDLPIITD